MKIVSPFLFPRPGIVISVPTHLFYRHRGIVSDRWYGGKPMVISGSARRGCVAEEPWDEFSQGAAVTIENYPTTLPPQEIVQRARTHVGSRYRLLDWNCEHLVAQACGQPPHSPQVAATVAMACLVVLVAAASR